MTKNPYGLGFQRLRPVVLARNDGLCQFCGIQRSCEVHHAMVDYPDHTEVREDQLTALCTDCHSFVTSVRKFAWRFNARPVQVLGVLRDYLGDVPFTEDLLSRVAGRRVSLPPARGAPLREMQERARVEATVAAGNNPEAQRTMKPSRYE